MKGGESYFGDPGLLDVLEGVGIDHGEAEEEDVRLGVGEGSDARIPLLTCNPTSEQRRRQKGMNTSSSGKRRRSKQTTRPPPSRGGDEKRDDRSLTCGIPKRELDLLAFHLDLRLMVIEHRGNVSVRHKREHRL